MSKPEYTLRQAISIYEMASRQYCEHIDVCEHCIGWFAEGSHCEEGHRIMLLHNKWIERMSRVARLEGVNITLPEMIVESEAT